MSPASERVYRVGKTLGSRYPESYCFRFPRVLEPLILQAALLFMSQRLFFLPFPAPPLSFFPERSLGLCRSRADLYEDDDDPHHDAGDHEH